MKTIKRNAPLAALVALFFAIGLSPFASALPVTHATPFTPIVQQQQQQQQGSQQFTGTIMQLKSGDFALITGKTDKGYSGHLLDDQTTAKKFANQKVTVTGTLNTSNNTIHVTNIKGS
jgi:hypothetical protein